jgi:hypothetical protein
MKKFTLISLLISAAFSSFSQVIIEKKIDEMTDEVAYLATRFSAINEDEDKGLVMDVVINDNGSGFEAKHIAIQTIGLGSCNENNTLIILFEDGSKFTLKSWNEFNCKSLHFFTLSDSNIELLSSSLVSKIRITNGRDHSSVTVDVDFKNYFIEFYNQLDLLN